MAAVWGVSMMRDEQDVAYDVIRHLAHEGLDGVLVADNLSTDDTVAGLLDAATDTGLRVEIIVDDEVGYWQSSKMTRLAQRAADWGADWIIPFDADEVWCSSNGAPLATTLRNLNADIADAALVNHFATDRDSNDPCVFRRQLWRQQQWSALAKVAFRWRNGAVIAQGNHNVSMPGRVSRLPALKVHHFPYRSADHFVHKAGIGAAAYAATDLPETMGAHWRQYGAILQNEGEDALRQVWQTHFFYVDPAVSGMVLDPAPYCGGA